MHTTANAGIGVQQGEAAATAGEARSAEEPDLKSQFNPPPVPEEQLKIGKSAIWLAARLSKVQIKVAKQCWPKGQKFSRTKFQVLLAIATEDGPSEAELAEIIGFHQATSSRNLTELAKEGWIKSARRRTSRGFQLTPKTRKWLEMFEAEVGRNVLIKGCGVLERFRELSSFLRPTKKRAMVLATNQTSLDLSGS